MGELFNYFCGLVTLVSFGYAIIQGRKSAKLELQIKSLDWTDIQSCANDLGSKIKQDGFVPDLIFTPGVRAASFAFLLEGEFNNTNIPSFVGMSFWKGYKYSSAFIENHLKFETARWEILIPETMLRLTDKKILIVDDFALTGSFISRLREILISRGFKPEYIKTATIVVTRVAKKNGNCPDYFWKETNDDDFYFPWGKAK